MTSVVVGSNAGAQCRGSCCRRVGPSLTVQRATWVDLECSGRRGDQAARIALGSLQEAFGFQHQRVGQLAFSVHGDPIRHVLLERNERVNLGRRFIGCCLPGSRLESNLLAVGIVQWRQCLLLHALPRGVLGPPTARRHGNLVTAAGLSESTVRQAIPRSDLLDRFGPDESVELSCAAFASGNCDETMAHASKAIPAGLTERHRDTAVHNRLNNFR